MARFDVNRQWAFVLALGVSLVCCSLVTTNAVAQATDPTGHIADPFDPGYVPPPSAGDPDWPSGGSKMNKPGSVTKHGRQLGRNPAGDGTAPRSVWTWRFRVVWQALRNWHTRF